MTTWRETLDAFEQRLADQRAALDRGELEAVPAFVPPRGLGELGGDDLDRARALLNDADDLTTELEGALAHVREDLLVVRRLVSATGDAPTARFFDSSL